jgi:hypothetical protein
MTKQSEGAATRASIPPPEGDRPGIRRRETERKALPRSRDISFCGKFRCRPAEPCQPAGREAQPEGSSAKLENRGTPTDINVSFDWDCRDLRGPFGGVSFALVPLEVFLAADLVGLECHDLFLRVIDFGM